MCAYWLVRVHKTRQASAWSLIEQVSQLAVLAKLLLALILYSGASQCRPETDRKAQLAALQQLNKHALAAQV